VLFSLVSGLWKQVEGLGAVVFGGAGVGADGVEAGVPSPLRLLANRYRQYRQEPPTGPVLAVAVGRWPGWAAGPAA
jgi:hypothetical protein